MRSLMGILATALVLLAFAAPARADLLTSLEAHWKLNETSGTRSDSHGSNDLTDNNTVTQAAGKIDNATQHTNANSEYLSIADNASLSVAGHVDLTVAAWVYLDNKTGNQGFVAKWASSGNWEYMLRYDSGADRLRFYITHNGSTASVLSANQLGSPSASTWYFIVAWHDPDADEQGLQVNNGTADTKSHSLGVYDGAAAFTIGSESTANYLDGRVDSASVWKRQLTTGEKTDLYNAGAGFDYPFGGGGGARSFGVIIYNIPAGFPIGGLW